MEIPNHTSHLKNMFKSFFKILFITFLLSSCKQKEVEKFYWLSFAGSDYEKIDTNRVFHIDNSQSGDTTIISYFSQRDTIQYLLLNSKQDSSFIKSSYEDKGYLRPLFDTTILLNRDTFKIIEYGLNEFITDGSSLYYYTPRLGIFATHSGTWPGIKILQSSDTITNRKIKRLINAIVPKFYIRGALRYNL